MGDLFSDYYNDTRCDGGWLFSYYTYVAYYALLKFGEISENNKGWLIKMAIDPTPYHHIRTSNPYCAKEFVEKSVRYIVRILQRHLESVKKDIEKEGKVIPPPIESCIRVDEGKDSIPNIKLDPILYEEYKNDSLMNSRVNWWCKSFILNHARILYNYFKKDSISAFTGNPYKITTLEMINICCPFSDLEKIVENEKRKLDELKNNIQFA